MADDVPSSNEESTNQKLALVEQSLDALYQTMDKIQGEKNHVGIVVSDECTVVFMPRDRRSGGILFLSCLSFWGLFY
jgi:hypothetical protein